MCLELKVGQCVTAVVDQVKNEGRLVRFSVSPPSSQNCAEATQGWNLTNLLPGLLVKATVKKVEPLVSRRMLLRVSHVKLFPLKCKSRVYLAGDQARIDPELPVLV